MRLGGCTGMILVQYNTEKGYTKYIAHTRTEGMGRGWEEELRRKKQVGDGDEN